MVAVFRTSLHFCRLSVQAFHLIMYQIVNTTGDVVFRHIIVAGRNIDFRGFVAKLVDFKQIFPSN